MILFPNAKINLGLQIERKREDGYHDISTVFYPIPLCDAVEVTEAKETALHTYGNAVDCPPEKNLVMKAYRMMAEEFDLPQVGIHLYKHIPDGAGLGGGSSDATAVAKILNAMFSLGLDDAGIAKRVKRLGADCPFFAYNRPMTARGIGDLLQPINVDLRGWKMIVVKPDVSVPTAAAYAGVTPKIPETAVEEIVQKPVAEWENLLVNDFEKSIFALHPELAALKQSLYDSGAAYASMSGSGSAIFGIFESDKLADAFAAKCPQPRLYKLNL